MAYKSGDATYETSGWHGDGAVFINNFIDWFFARGGASGNTNPDADAGVFTFGGFFGGANGYSGSFRMCLAVK